MRVVTYTTLFPNPTQKNHGIFVETRLQHLLAAVPSIDCRVVAPVPWLPPMFEHVGDYAQFANIPPRETKPKFAVEHPRYVVIPKIGMSVTPAMLYAATLPVLRRLQRERDFDLIDAHYFYPDGVAAVWLGQTLGKPVVVTARGTDVNLIPRHFLPRRAIKWAASRASGIIAVSHALKDAITALGIPAEAVTVLRNGVDLERFHPGGRAEARLRLGLGGRVLASVGLLIERKGHNFVIEAMKLLPGYTLLIAGDGPDKVQLQKLAVRAGVENRVRFLGSVPHVELQSIYAAADALVLASSREGWPNVLLESMACGTPVAATNVWGNPEVVAEPAAGQLMRERSAQGVADAVKRLFDNLPNRADTRRYAERFSWDDTSQGQIDLFQRVLQARGELADVSSGTRSNAPAV